MILYQISRYGDVKIWLSSSIKKVIVEVLYVFRFTKNILFYKKLKKANRKICIKFRIFILLNKSMQIIATYIFYYYLFKLDSIILS